ncbi:protein of unknown function [Rhizobiales bacterium GAS191]|nr:protein of unknown function [Rhizobiales bacterium GAS188]SEE40727.1 protein of unknown function [Rhizobiales bacterium GAS191]
MNTDNAEGAARKTIGQVEEIAGRTLKDKRTTGQGLYDQAAGNVQSAYGHARDAIASGASDIAKGASETIAKTRDAVSQGTKTAVDGLANSDFAALRDDLAKLTQTVGLLVQNQATSTRDQVMDVVGTAGDNITQSAAVAQDRLVSLEAEFEARIQKNPLSAVAIAIGVGVLIGKMT